MSTDSTTVRRGRSDLAEGARPGRWRNRRGPSPARFPDDCAPAARWAVRYEVDERPAEGRVRRMATRVPRATRSAGEARDFVGEALRSWAVPEELVCDVVLAASELVTNAIEHGAGEVGVEIGLRGDKVVLRVQDQAKQAPVRKAASWLSARSRGLKIVEALSSGWGHQPGPDGKWVWAEFEVPAPQSADGAGADRLDSVGSLPPDK